MRSEIRRALANLNVGRKANVEGIVENRLTTWANVLQQIVKTFYSTFEDTLPTSYFNSNDGLKSAMSNVLEQAVCKVVR